jgi:hypothetical protein
MVLPAVLGYLQAQDVVGATLMLLDAEAGRVLLARAATRARAHYWPVAAVMVRPLSVAAATAFNS